jgi:hypothetical protein
MKKSLLHNTNKVAQEAGASNSIIFVLIQMKVIVNHQSLSIFWDLPNDLWTALIPIATIAHPVPLQQTPNCSNSTPTPIQ